MRIVRNNDANGNNLDKHFRELRNLESPPATDLWDKLADELDAERARVKHDHWYKALIALLIPFTIINILITYDLADYYAEKNNGNEQTDFLEFVVASTGKAAFPGSAAHAGGWGNFLSGARFFASDAGSTSAGAEDESILQFEEFSGDLIEMKKNLPVTEIKSQADGKNHAAGTQTLIERIMLESAATADDVLKIYSRKMTDESLASVKGFHIGIGGSVNNYWMMHKANSLHPLVGNNINRKFGVAATYGISMGYDFSHKFGIEAEWIIQSKQGQQYRELRYGKIPVDGEVNLEYMHVPVMFKYKWTKVSVRSPHPRAINLISGIQYSRLKGASVARDGFDMKEVNSLFNQNELGVILGLEYDIFVHRNYFFSVGARASFSTDARAFPYFHSDKTDTYNALIGLNASFHYLAKRKPGK